MILIQIVIIIQLWFCSKEKTILKKNQNIKLIKMPIAESKDINKYLRIYTFTITNQNLIKIKQNLKKI
jgi:hypothetical protein